MRGPGAEIPDCGADSFPGLLDFLIGEADDGKNMEAGREGGLHGNKGGIQADDLGGMQRDHMSINE